MVGDRYVLLGLARARAAWFRTVAQWVTSAVLPAEFLKCVSVEEVRAHLRTGGGFSALLLDGGLPPADRDLIDACRAVGCAVFIVDDGRVERDWRALGATAVLPADLTRECLLDALATGATMVASPDATAALVTPALGATAAPWAGGVTAVCGPGGTGASTVAIALAQGLAADRAAAGNVLLADLCRHAEQGMLHDAGEVFPGVQELVEAHRSGALPHDEVRALAFEVAERGYHLLLGLRQARHWPTLRPRAFETAFTALRLSYRTVVCDIDADFETEDDTGSADVAERCLPARTAAQHADVVFAVGLGGMKGLHALVRVVAELIGAGVPAERVQPVINLAPRQPRSRTELAAAFGALAGPAVGRQLAGPLFLPRRKVEEALRDGARLPNPLPQMLAAAWRAGRDRGKATRPQAGVVPERVRPGTLGSWSITHDEAAGA
jgi:hypothetical protein